MQKKALIISLIFNFAFIILFSAFTIKKGGLQYLFGKIEEVFSTESSGDSRYSAKYHGRKSIFEVLPEEEDEIIFLGCSLTEHGQWNELFNNPKVKNRGIGGDETSGIINRLDDILYSNPKKIFLKVGINDLRQKVPIDSILSNFEKIVTTIREKSPSTELYLKSILPVNNKFYRYKIKNEDIITLNKSIKQLAEENSLVYIDLHSHFANNENQLLEDYTFDGIHINGRGYIVWKSVVEEYVH